MQILIPLAVLSLILAFSASRSTEAPTGFDNKSNGVADDATHEADQNEIRGSRAGERWPGAAL